MGVAYSVTIVSVIVFTVIVVVKRNTLFNTSSECPEGECPISLITGMKDCSRSTFYPGLELCSVSDSCNNPLMPYTINTDLSTSYQGTCETEYCRCSPNPSCANYISTVFNDAYQQSPNSGRSDNLQYCSISPDSISQLGCNGSVSQCMMTNPCSYGNLVYLADPSTLNISNMDLLPLACVARELPSTLTQGSVYIYDDQSDTVVTKQL